MAYNKNERLFIPSIEKSVTLNGEVLVEHYVGRCFEKYYLIRSLDEIEGLLKRAHTGDIVTVYKNKQLSCRGVLDGKYKEKVLSEYRNYHYGFFVYATFPNELEEYAVGYNVDELNQQLDEMLTEDIGSNLFLCFGIHPKSVFTKTDLNENDEVILISG